MLLPWAGLAAVWLAQAGAQPAPAPAEPAPIAAPAAPAEPAPDEPALAALEPVCQAIARELGGLRSLAVTRLQQEGGRRATSDLEAYLARALGRRAELELVLPEEVPTDCDRREERDRLACLTQRLGLEAALGGRLIQTPQGDDLALLLVDARGRVLLDESFPLGRLPPPAAPVEISATPLEDSLRAARDALRTVPDATHGPAAAELAPDGTAPPGPAAEESGAASGADARLAFQLRRLELTLDGDGWRVTQAGQERVTDLELSLRGGRPDLVARVERELDGLTFRRDLGIGLTLAGVVLAGLTLPFLKAEDDAVFGAGIGTVGGGLAVAVAGAVLWGLYGPRAGGLERGASDQHLLERGEAEQLVRAYNDSLLRELGLSF